MSTGDGDAKFLAYTAGFFDADGFVGIYLYRNEECRRGGYYSLSCSICQSLWMPIFLEWKGRWAGTLWPGPNGREFDRWTWALTGRKALAFLQDILPYVRHKRDQVKLAIEFQSETKHGKHGARGLSDEEFARQESIALEVKRLKKVGPAPPENHNGC